MCVIKASGNIEEIYVYKFVHTFEPKVMWKLTTKPTQLRSK